ncbi:hypothetical protein BGZ92_005446, partial [Podila epicladia]
EWDRSGDGAEKKHGQTELQQLRAQVSDFVKQQAGPPQATEGLPKAQPRTEEIAL